MGPTVAVIVVGVLYLASFAALVVSFARLRSDMHAGFDRLDDRFDRLDDRFDQLEAKFDRHFDRLEAKFDGLIMGLARSGHLTDSEVPSGADD